MKRLSLTNFLRKRVLTVGRSFSLNTQELFHVYSLICSFELTLVSLGAIAPITISQSVIILYVFCLIFSSKLFFSTEDTKN